MEELLASENIKIMGGGTVGGTALGLGDIIISLILLREKIIKSPIVINLNYFKNNEWYPNPLNALQFRISLIKIICMMCGLDFASDIAFCFCKNMVLDQHLSSLKLITKWLSDFTIPVELCGGAGGLVPHRYIIFHTKFRLLGRSGNDQFMGRLDKLISAIKLPNYTIVLMGEQKMVPTSEQKFHRIDTIYPLLLKLKQNNNVIDLTKETIYNSLNINDYMHDCSIIKGAYKNILVGFSGQLVMCLSFAPQSIICLALDKIDTMEFHKNMYDHIFYEFDKYQKCISELV